MKNIFIVVLLLCFVSKSYCQFNTIQKNKDNYIIIERNLSNSLLEDKDSISIDMPTGIEFDHEVTTDEFRKARKLPPRQTKTKIISNKILTDLTINNLYKEIIDNGIQHPKIVLAQAILETGWFKSSVCKHKGNLFGLTNPKTGEYYIFNHWKESVKAYKDKVQYKYKGGNYLLWLQKIGYAEDPRYVSSLIKILEQYFL